MRVSPALLGAVVVGGVGLFAAAVDTQAQAPPPSSRSQNATPAASASAPATAHAVAEDPRSKPIRAALQAFTQAYNVPDVKALGEMFLEDALVIDSGGSETRGKAAITEMYSGSFQNTPGLKLESELEKVQFLTADVARAEGRSRLFAGTGDANEFTRYSALLVQKDGKWRIAELREAPVPPAEIRPYDRLQELEWMVGDWVDESDENRVVVNVRWADKQSYLIRTYSVEIRGVKSSSGTMFIGWDPLNEQVKSWVFDSEGGHGEGLWTRTSNDQWIVKAQGVLRDGRPTSATHIHSILNKDAVKSSSIDRIIGGQIAPDILDIVMVRKPPQPTTGAGAPRPASGSQPR